VKRVRERICNHDVIPEFTRAHRSENAEGKIPHICSERQQQPPPVISTEGGNLSLLAILKESAKGMKVSVKECFSRGGATQQAIVATNGGFL
jgi:hypothetical protein